MISAEALLVVTPLKLKLINFIENNLEPFKKISFKVVYAIIKSKSPYPGFYQMNQSLLYYFFLIFLRPDFLQHHLAHWASPFRNKLMKINLRRMMMTGRRCSPGGSWSQTGTVMRRRRRWSRMTTCLLREERTTM